jgi:hypothetical protein
LLGKQIGNLRILFGGGLTNVDVAPSLERWMVTLWWLFKVTFQGAMVFKWKEPDFILGI